MWSPDIISSQRDASLFLRLPKLSVSSYPCPYLALTSAPTMRLRSHIRPPQRLVDEIQNGAAAAGSLRQATSPPRPPFIDFNPNLPPAAFPTLSAPRPASSDANGPHADSNRPAATRHDEGRTGTGRIQGSGTGNCAKTSNHRIGDELADVPMELLDNYAASNGDQNPTYRRNLTMMAACNDERAEPLGMSDSEEEPDRSSSIAVPDIVSIRGPRAANTRIRRTESENRTVPWRPSGTT